jgi:hypothetical protein
VPAATSPCAGSRAAWPAVDCASWGEPFDAFPVEAPFQVRPDLVKLSPPDDWLRVDRQWAAMLKAKQAALAGHGTEPPAANIALAHARDPVSAAGRLAAIARAVHALAATAAGRQLGIACAATSIDFAAAGYRVDTANDRIRLQAVREDAVPVVRAIQGAGRGPLCLLGALAMSLQEDLVLMERDAAGVIRAVLFHVSFPSAWNPATKVGNDLLALHAPVADNAPLQEAADRLGNALIAKGPFVRWVWTVTGDSRWRAWPPLPAPRSRLYFRLERQSTMPLGEGYGLFLIRVQVRPLEQALAAPGRLDRLQASLRSMSAAMVRYKNLTAVRDALLDQRPGA